MSGSVRRGVQKPVLVFITVALVSVILLLVATRVVTGRWYSVRVFARSIPSILRALNDAEYVNSYNTGEFTNVIFLHHSVGNNLIEQGHVREDLTTAGYRFFDHSYNEQGLRTPEGVFAGYDYSVPDSNTDPDGLAAVFTLPNVGSPLNALGGLLQHEVIVFKSCYWVSNITDDDQLAKYKLYYQSIRDVMDQHHDKLFIVVTPPPVNPAGTNTAEAARAREFARWLKSDEFLSGHPNVTTFDLYSYLADDDPESVDYGMLRFEYREGADSHPNRSANELIGPQLADFIANAAQAYRVVYAGHANMQVALQP